MSDHTAMKVAVIGLGTMGSMALWQLARAGVQVDGYERFNVGHDFGAGGGGTRMFRLVYAEGAAYLDLLRESRLLWGELACELGHEVMVRNGAMTIADEGSVAVRRSVEMARQCDIPYELMGARTVGALFPQHRLAPGEVAVFDPMGGVIHTERGIRGAVQMARGLGAQVFEHARVEAIEPDESGVSLTVAGITRRYDQVVVSTGPWVNPVLERTGRRLETRRVFTSFHRPRKGRLLDPHSYPSAIRRKGADTLATMSSLDGNTVKMVIQTEEQTRFVPADEAQLTRPGRAYYDEVARLVEWGLPDVDPDPIRVLAYPEGFTADSEGVVGRFEDIPNTVLLCGFSGQGFKLAPGIGKAAAEIVISGETALLPVGMAPRAFDDADNPQAREMATLWFDVGNT